MSKWIAEFELEDGDTMPEHMDLEYKGGRIDFYCKPLDQEPIDYKAQYENYLKKSEVVISQLRADRDRLLKAFDEIRTEIEKLQTYKMFVGEKTVYVERDDVLAIIDKHRGESGE